MVCIYCKNLTRVVNSRTKARTPSTWRRRRCTKCVAQFSTVELPDFRGSLSVRRDLKHLDPFLRDKLFISIYKALGHRPTALDDTSALANTIISKLLKSPQAIDGIILRPQIALVVYETLKRFDTAGSATYKAYHNDVL